MSETKKYPVGIESETQKQLYDERYRKFGAKAPTFRSGDEAPPPAAPSDGCII